MLLIVGIVIGLAIGLRAGTWWAFTRLGNYERLQRHYRVRHWRSGN